MNKPRLIDLDRAKGLAILLVVIGHIVARTPPAGNEWYLFLKFFIYKFHMPFFMFICGFIMYYSYTPLRSFRDYKNYVSRKLLRLMPAFLLFGLFICLVKLISQKFMYVDNPPSNFWWGVVELGIRPGRSASGSLWFIYVLSIYYIIMPIFLTITQHRLKILLILGLAVHFLPGTTYFALDRVFEYWFVFTLGMYAAENIETYFNLIDRFNVLFIVLFLASLSIAFTPISPVLAKLIIGLCALPALHAFVRLSALTNDIFLKTLGDFTFPIYLMNTLFIGLVKGIAVHFISWEYGNFIFFFFLLLLSGLWLPILTKKIVIKKIPWLDRITT